MICDLIIKYVTRKNPVTNEFEMAVGRVAGAKRSEDTLAALESAKKLTVMDEDGQQVDFGSLFKDNKTIVIFVRVSLLR